MVAIAFLALTLPIAMVLVTARSLLIKKNPPASAEAVAAASAPLQKSLEDMADKSLAPLTLSEDQSRIELSSADPAADLARVRDLASRFQASTLSPSESAGETRLLVTLAESRAGDFAKACRDPAFEPAISPAAPDQPRTLLEIVIRKKSP